MNAAGRRAAHGRALCSAHGGAADEPGGHWVAGQFPQA